jgi:hypothetical protein
METNPSLDGVQNMLGPWVNLPFLTSPVLWSGNPQASTDCYLNWILKGELIYYSILDSYGFCSPGEDIK